MSAKGDPRLVALTLIEAVLRDGHSLSQALERPAMQQLTTTDKGLARELASGVLRHLPRLRFWAGRLLQKPLKAKDGDMEIAILLGLYQLAFLRVPAYAAVHATSGLARKRKKNWATGLINGVLRNFQRRQQELETAVAADEEAASCHPAWLLGRLQQAWPEHWRQITEANNQRPPMTLRVNGRRLSREDYLARLAAAGVAAREASHTAHGIVLDEAREVSALPGFAEGWFSVQDGAAQLAAELLQGEDGQRILDACAAPGGKTAHILERCQPRQLLAIDSDAVRLARVEENLSRLGLEATLVAADAADTPKWFDGEPFDRILLDAPCSATGVIRRNPDIKWLRRDEDIDNLARCQARLLDALWPLLKSGGILVYATCSVLPQENARQVEAFLARTRDAESLPLTGDWGLAQNNGRQILPGMDEMDGFYYACLRKKS